MKQGRKLATTKKDLAERLGTATTTREGSGKLLQDLIELKARYENFGLYPELTEAARMWDGKSEPDPIAQAMGLTDAENERLAAEAGMSREEWEEAQRVAEAKREAEKATGSLFGDGGSFSLAEAKEKKLFDKDGVLEAENATVFAAGTSFSIIAYHVSPNDFDEFKTKFIGAGLGAQMLGWGIYFTDDVQMNKVYVRKVAKKTGKSPVNYRVELDIEQEDLLTLDGELSPEMRERLRPLYEEMLAKLPEEAKRPDVEYWKEEYAFRTGFDFQIFLERCLEREGKGEKEVSLALLKHGVKGSKLKLDNGASYIVAFDENDIKITAKGYEATGYEWQDMEEDGGHGSFSIAGERVPREEAVRIAREFGALSESEGVRVEAPEVYAEDGKEARAFAREVYRKLQEETAGGKLLEMPDGRRAKVSRRGLSEVKNHSADRRVLAALCALRDLCRQSIYINSAANTQPEKKGKKGIVRFHYYIAKGNFVGASAVNERAQDEAYVNIVLSEYENGDLFYDLDATNVEDVNKNEGVSATLPGARIPNAGEQKGEAPYVGRIQQTKQFVNYVNKKIKEEGAGSHGSFSVIGPHARTWDKHADRAFAGRDDGKMRAEIDASQARLKGAWTDFSKDDLLKLLDEIATPEEKKKLDELRKVKADWLDAFSRDPEKFKKFPALDKRLKELQKELTADGGVADRVLDELGYDFKSDPFAVGTIENDKAIRGARFAVFSGYRYDLSKYNKYRNKKERKLGDILDYPELFAAYPELKGMKVYAEQMTGWGGAYQKGIGWSDIHINENLLNDPDKLRSVLLHEVQHAIQDIEGFARGTVTEEAGKKRQELLEKARGNLYENQTRLNALAALPEDAKGLRFDRKAGREEIERRYKEAHRAAFDIQYENRKKRETGKEVTAEDEAAEKKARALSNAYLDLTRFFNGYYEKGLGSSARAIEKNLKKQIKQDEDFLNQGGLRPDLSDYEVYLRAPGEIESRNVQERRDWTAEQRQATPFNDTLEYPGEAVNFGSFSVTEAKEKKLFDKDGIMQAANGVLIDGASFSETMMHASPHWIQGKFRMDKIGSGEGAQMFGSGMYFTENPGVNDRYLSQFRRRGGASWLVNGKEVDEKDLEKVVPGLEESGVSAWLFECKDNRDFLEQLKKLEKDITGDIKLEIEKIKAAIELYEDKLKGSPLWELTPADRQETEQYLKEYREDLKNQEKVYQKLLEPYKKMREWIKAGNTIKAESGAYNYRVEIDAEEGELFYWDIPMSDKENAGALKRLRNSPVEEVRKLAYALKLKPDALAEEVYTTLTEQMRQKHGLGNSRKDDALAQRYASEALLASGIKGHKYADGFTRHLARSEWLYNSVVFDMDSIRITHVARGNRDWKPYVPREEEPGGASMSVVIPPRRICRTRQEALATVGGRGGSLILENRFLNLKAVFNSKSKGKFAHKDSLGRTFEALQPSGMSDEDIKTAHFSAYGNIVELFANAERMKYERAYKDKEVRKGFLHVYSPFELEGMGEKFEANIELMIFKEKGKTPMAYLLNVSLAPAAGQKGRGAGFPNLPIYLSGEIKSDFPDIVKREEEKNYGGSFSVIGPRAKTFSKYVDKAFLGRDDGKMRAEIDASQARLKGAWTAPKDLDRLATPGEKKKLDELRKVSADWVEAFDRDPEKFKKFPALDKRLKELRKELEEEEGLAEGRANILVSHLFPLLLTVLLTTKSMSFIIEIVLDFPLAASL